MITVLPFAFLSKSPEYEQLGFWQSFAGLRFGNRASAIISMSMFWVSE
jgi:hypothetical protein